ncbi:hypothetical protein GOD62_08130 [Sinorhizobium medicae]|nr:hypothetical protein [Sinorhizobium medicae]MDX0792673.1 hypothetical protein [Sinorhizobium medicae]
MLNSSIHWEVGCLTDIGVNAMRVFLKTSFAAFALSSALVGAAAPAFADSYYQGLDPNNPPGTQNQERMSPMRSMPSTSVDPTATGSIDDGRIMSPSGTYHERYQTGEGDYYRGITPPKP